MKYKVSVIIPVYNSEQSIERCVRSLLSQVYSYIEILLINDGSSDNSRIICDKLAKEDKRVVTFHQKNYGVSYSRNVGIKNVSGDYLCFVDSDDYVDEYYIQNFIDGLLKGDELVFQGIKILKDGIIDYKCPIGNKYYEADILNGISDINRLSIFGYVCNKLYKTDIIRKHNLFFDTDINISEDRIFALQYMKFVNCLVTIPKCSYVYEIKETGLTCRLRSYKELKKAADINLTVALELLEKYSCDRFECDTKRMYVLSSYSYIRSLFILNNYHQYIKEKYKEYLQHFRSWQKFYEPTDRMHKIMKFIISIPIDSLSFALMYNYMERKK